MEKSKDDPKDNTPLYETQEKKVIFFALIVAISFENLLWMAIICLFPIFIVQHHESINTFETGLILSVFHLSTLIITPFIGRNLHHLGRKNALVISFFFASMAALGYTTLSFVSSTSVFTIGSILIRLIEGVTTSLNSTAVYALAPIEFPNNKEKVIGYLEMSAGLGLTVGPFISGIIYTYFHYAGTFFFFCLLLMSAGLFL